MDLCHTPVSQMKLSAELRNIILERNLLTTKTRMKVLSALEEEEPLCTENFQKVNLRSKAIDEILTSEATYLHHLELIMKYFMEPIREKNLISNEDYTIIFGNVETIYHVNGELLNELKSNPENVAAAFLKLAPFLKLYSVYAYDYERALHCLDKKSLELCEFIRSQESRPEVSTKLISLLITPIQRVPRYCLLLKEVITHTPSSHPDVAVLQGAFQQVESSAQHINSLMQEQKNMQDMLTLQKSFHKGKPQIVSPGRKYIKAGKLMKVCRKGRKVQPRYFILLSDMLLYCKLLSPDPSTPNSLSCNCVLPLKKCQVQWVIGKTMFKVSCLAESFVLYSSSPEESESWVDALTEAVKQYQAFRQTLRKESSAKRPLRGQLVNSLWQSESPRSKGKGRKRSLPEDLESRLERSGKKTYDNLMHADSNSDCPSPHKMRKIAKEKTAVLKECTNEASSSSDSLFPMRQELTKCNQQARTSGGISKENINNGAELQPSLTSELPSIKSSDRNPLESKNDQCNSNGNSFKQRRRNTWHNRCYRLVHSLSVNIHHSFRKQVARLSSHPDPDLSD